VNIFLWHVHGAYTTALVQGDHQYFVPTTPDRGPDGRGRAQTYDWPDNVHEVDFAAAHELDVDVAILQRPAELDHLACDWLGGRRPGSDVPAVYLEHNTPPDASGNSRHPAADRDDVVVVHVTHCNAVYWDAGCARTRVVEHGIVDPGLRYTGSRPRLTAVINEPIRRGRVVGADLLDSFRQAAPLDLFGMETKPYGGRDVCQRALHDEMSQRRAYVHPIRWTSLGLSLLEAMHLGMPVVALAATEVPRAVPQGCGFVSCDVDELVNACRMLVADREQAAAIGRCARGHALRRYGLARFLRDWNAVFEEVAR